MLEDKRIRAILSEADAQQAERARLYQRLDQLTDMCDVRTFVDVLADVATMHARLGSPKQRREWDRLAEELEAYLKPAPVPVRSVCREDRERP
jgi:hypothetical protein